MTDPVHKLLDGADLAPATQRASLTDWRAFTSWAQQRSRRPLPADPDTIVSWLADQAVRDACRWQLLPVSGE